jgi:hypothetical protein
MILINWYRAKKAELKVKGLFYGTIASFVDNKSGRLQTILNLIDSVRGLTGEELRTEFIAGLAGIIHDEAEQERQENANEE